MLLPMANPAQAGGDGYWNNGYWCDHTNQYCWTQPDPDYYHEPYSPEQSYYQYNNKSPFRVNVNVCISILGMNICN